VYFQKNTQERASVCAFVSLYILFSYKSHYFSSYSTRCEIHSVFSSSVTKHPTRSFAHLLGASVPRTALMWGLTLCEFCEISVLIIPTFLQLHTQHKLSFYCKIIIIIIIIIIISGTHHINMPSIGKEQYINRYDRVRAQLYFNIYMEIWVKLDNKHRPVRSYTEISRNMS
jgi:hypothetical protein